MFLPHRSEWALDAHRRRRPFDLQKSAFEPPAVGLKRKSLHDAAFWRADRRSGRPAGGSALLLPVRDVWFWLRESGRISDEGWEH